MSEATSLTIAAEKDALSGRKKRGSHPIFHAIRQGEYERVKKYLSNGPHVASVLSIENLTPLLLASHLGKNEIAKLLLRAGANVNASTLKGKAALHLAVESENMKLVQLLTEKGANVDARNEGGHSPLHLASFTGNTRIIRFLIKRGANVNLKSRRGLTPTAIAKQKKHTEAVRVLKEAGGRI